MQKGPWIKRAYHWPLGLMAAFIKFGFIFRRSNSWNPEDLGNS